MSLGLVNKSTREVVWTTVLITTWKVFDIVWVMTGC